MIEKNKRGVVNPKSMAVAPKKEFNRSKEAVTESGEYSNVTKRNVKDTVFSDLFKDKRNLLKLYRVLHPEDTAASEDELDIVTIKNILVNDLYNDLGFTVKGKLVILTEAQSK